MTNTVRLSASLILACTFSLPATADEPQSFWDLLTQTVSETAKTWHARMTAAQAPSGAMVDCPLGSTRGSVYRLDMDSCDEPYPTVTVAPHGQPAEDQSAEADGNSSGADSDTDTDSDTDGDTDTDSDVDDSRNN